MNTLIAVLLIVHGLITSAQSAGSFSPGAGIPNPSWLSWWPTGLGQSWLFSRPGLEHSFLIPLGGLLYLVAGLALVAAGLGLLGWIVPTAWWPVLALVGAGLSLFMLLVYLHPFYLIGIAASLAVLVSMLWVHWPSFMKMPV